MSFVRRLTFLSALVAAGCNTTSSPQARDENRKMDALARMAGEMERDAAKPALLARSQGPEVLPPVKLGSPKNQPAPPLPGIPPTPPLAEPPIDVPPPSVGNDSLRLPPTPPTTPANPDGAVGLKLPDITPVAAPPITPVSGVKEMPPTPPASVARLEGDSQVRIVASIGQNPIYESEVREAVYQRMHELAKLLESQRKVREREIFREELRKIIERELVLEEMTAALTAKKQTSALGRLRDAAAKEAENRIKEFKKERNIPSDQVFAEVLRSQGLTLAGIKRQIERGFMYQTYLREKLSPKMDAVGLADVREYFAAHADEFKSEDRVLWQDCFVLTERFKSPEEARQYADAIAARAAKGEDFIKLASELSMGDSKFRNGAGVGERPGEIFPADLEPTILAMKTGQVTVKETATGFHVLRIAQRNHAGVKEYDDKMQAEVRRRLQGQIYEREAKRYVDTLWKRSQPQVWVD